MPVRQQSTSPQDRPDVRFYAESDTGTLSELATDLGQYEADLTVGPGVVYESATTRMDLGSPRAVAMRVGNPSGQTGVLFRHGSGAALERLEVVAGPALVWTLNNAAALSVAWPGGAGDIVVAIASEPNPATTGPADAIMSWIYLAQGSTIERHKVEHATKTLGSATVHFGADSTLGANAYGGDIERIRFSSRMVSFTEIAQDWIAALPDPASVAKLQRQGLPLTEASGAGDGGEFHGPAVQWAAAELRHAQWRTMGALANWRFRNVESIAGGFNDNAGSRAKTKLAPGGAVASGGEGFHLYLGWFGVFPVAPTANRLWVEVHARCYDSSGDEDVEFGFRIYSFTRKPWGPLAGALDPADYSSVETRFVSDEDAPGSWRLQTIVPIRRGESGVAKGKTYIGLAYAHDLNGNTTGGRIEVHAVHAVQIFDTTLGLPPGGGPGGEGG